MDWQKCYDGNSAQLKMSDQQGNFHFSLFWANYKPQKAIHSKHSRTKTTIQQTRPGVHKVKPKGWLSTPYR